MTLVSQSVMSAVCRSYSVNRYGLRPLLRPVFYWAVFVPIHGAYLKWGASISNITLYAVDITWLHLFLVAFNADFRSCEQHERPYVIWEEDRRWTYSYVSHLTCGSRSLNTFFFIQTPLLQWAPVISWSLSCGPTVYIITYEIVCDFSYTCLAPVVYSSPSPWLEVFQVDTILNLIEIMEPPTT